VNPDSGEGLGPDKANPATPHGSSVTHTDRAASPTEPTPELKPLPANLRYEYLGPNNSYPVIVNACLSPEQTAKLLEKLKIHKGAIGYSIKDLKGINPTICSHRILLEDCHKPSVEHQRRLNPNLKEEFDLEIKDKKGIENTIADHLSRIRLEDESDTLLINDLFPNEQLLAITSALYEADTASIDSHSVRVVHDTGRVTYHSDRVNSLAEPWYADITNFLASGPLARTYPLSDPSITDVYHLVYNMRQEQGAILRDLTDRVGAIEAELRDWRWYEYDFDPDSGHGAADH
jgi:hypothetical protein